jgi:CRISPR-associated protein Csy2
VDAKCAANRTLATSRQKSGAYFDDYQITNFNICQILNRLIGVQPLKTRKKRNKARQDQSKILRKQIALWILPLIELRERLDTEPTQEVVEFSDPLVQEFMTLPEIELVSLATKFNHRIHYVFQECKFTHVFAYHPKLMQVIKSQITWILDQLGKPATESCVIGEEQYIYLSSLRVEDAVAMNSPYLCGAPSMTAIWGFIHNYERQVNKFLDDPRAMEFSSFSVFIRSEDIKSTAKLTEPNSVAKIKKISNAKRPTIRCERLSDLVFDVVIRVHGQHRLSDYMRELRAALPSSFAGGALFQPTISSGINWLKTFTSKAELYFNVKGLPAYGRWLYPSDDQPESFNELEEMLQRDESTIAASLGFHFLESPVERYNALTAQHVYAENVLGVMSRVNPIEVRFSGSDHFFNYAFWSLESTGETILIKKDKD